MSNYANVNSNGSYKIDMSMSCREVRSPTW